MQLKRSDLLSAVHSILFAVDELAPCVPLLDLGVVSKLANGKAGAGLPDQHYLRSQSRTALEFACYCNAGVGRACTALNGNESARYFDRRVAPRVPHCLGVSLVAKPCQECNLLTLAI